MKRILTAVAIAVLTIAASAQKLTVNVTGIRSNKGNVMIGVGDYKKNVAGMVGKMITANLEGVTAVFDSLPIGENHVYVYHAEDSDFNPVIIGQLMQPNAKNISNTNIPQGGFGIDNSGSWEPLINEGEQTINFSIKYINTKK